MENVNAIEIRNLTKSFKGMYALNGLNLTVPIGSIYGMFSEKAMAPYSSTLVRKIPWMEEPGGLQSMGSLRVGHD